MTTPLRRAIRGLRILWLRLRFRLWVTHLAIGLRRKGGRLLLRGPHPAWLEKRPRILVIAAGEGDGVLELALGRDVRIERDVVIEVWARGTSRLAIGDGTILRENTRLELRSGTIELGGDVEVRSLSLLNSYGRLTIGDRVIASRGVFVHCEERIEVGDRAALGEWVSLIDSDHTPDGSDLHFIDQPLRVEPIEIGPNVLVARGAAVLRGARVAKNSLVAANAVVIRGSYPPGRLLAGAPAKEVRRLPNAPDEDPAESRAGEPLSGER